MISGDLSGTRSHGINGQDIGIISTDWSGPYLLIASGDYTDLLWWNDINN